MALYRINQRNSFFKGSPGDLVEAEPGPFMDAAVISTILSRIGDGEPELASFPEEIHVEEEPPKRKKSKR